jgi:NFACT protein C-terminal domain
VVCGPWDALGPKLRWRVKMQPGTQKRGKALQEILRGWNKSIEDRKKKRLPPEGEPGREEEMLIRKEGELIRNIREAETIGNIPVGKIRLVMAGGGAKGGKDKGGGGGGGKGKAGGKGGGGGKGGKGKGKKK